MINKKIIMKRRKFKEKPDSEDSISAEDLKRKKKDGAGISVSYNRSPEQLRRTGRENINVSIWEIN